MFCRRSIVTATGVLTAATAKFPSFNVRYQVSVSAAKGPMEPPFPVERVWTLWNEGNLFSLNVNQLQSFLVSQKVQFDMTTAKKASLIRLVEQLLQNRDNQMKGVNLAGNGAPQQQQQDQYGRWTASGQQVSQTETLLDLHQAGFYENTASLAPKAFQILVNGHTCDLVVSRLNTTMFPGFPSNNECYTLSNAISDLALRARYSKALQWCVMNMRNLNLQGEFAVDFGKMIFKPEIVKKNRKLVGAWTLQQRAQIKNPYIWVSNSAEGAASDLEGFLKEEGFAPIDLKTPAQKHYFDVHVRRKKDVAHLELDGESSKCLTGYEPWYSLQRAHLISQVGGQDARLQLRTRTAMKPQNIQKMSSMKILDIKEDSVTSVLPPEMGQVIYTSENTVRVWVKLGEKGIQYTLREIRRTPLIVTAIEEEDERIEYVITTAVPAVDLNWFANRLFDIAKKFQEALSPSFVKAYDTAVKPLAFEKE